MVRSTISAAVFMVHLMILLPGAKGQDSGDCERILSRFRTDAGFVLENRLCHFADALENHEWLAALNFFDPEHQATQFDLYFNDEFMFGHLGEKGKRDTTKVVKLYLKETLSLYGSNKIASMDEIKLVYVKEVQKDGSVWNLVLDVELENGKTVKAACMMDSRSHLLFGAVG